jgi:hypothetical protein
VIITDNAYRDAYLVDWRFLLPALPEGGFDHLLIAGGTREHEDIALHLGLAGRVSTTPQPGDLADAVVVLADAKVDGAALAGHLVPGGSIYWEVDRRARGSHALTPARAFARLRKQGVSPAGAYWVKPWFPARHMYLPIHDPQAFRWYLDSICGSRTRSGRIARVAGRAFLRCHGSLAAVAPCYAVVGTRGTARPAALLASARAHGTCGTGPLQPVVLAHGGAPWNRLAMLLFTPGSSTPQFVVKSSRTTTFNAEVQWEHHVLRSLASTLSPALRRSIPTSTFFHWNGLAVAVESCVGGSSLSSRTGESPDIATEDLQLACEWLGAFHTETLTERAPAREWLTRQLVNGVCAEYQAMFGARAAESQLFAAVAQSVERFNGLTVPLCWQHTDFVPWNMFREHGELRVIDWEVARPGPAVADLLHFLIHWDADRYAHRHEEPQVRRILGYLVGVSEFPAGIDGRRVIDAYLGQMGVHPSLLPYLLVYTLAEQAVERGRRLRAAHGDGALQTDAFPFVAYLRAMAAQADRLFPSEERRAA